MTTTFTPRGAVTSMHHGPTLPQGVDDRVLGYGVIGLPFASGHYLAFRDFIASSFGPAYRSLWHRDPDGAWTAYSTVEPDLSCPRFIGAALASPPVTTPIDVNWISEDSLRIYIDDVLDWTLEIAATPATRLMSAMSQRMPASAWTNRMVLAAMGRMAGPLLSAGRMRLTGAMPNGQDFMAAPKRVWTISDSSATIGGLGAGGIGPLARQDRIGDFLLPQRGIFFADGVGRFALARSVQAR